MDTPVPTRIPAARPEMSGPRPRTRENDSMAVSANRLELLQIADAVAREKSIDRGIVIAAMEDAIAKAARSRYGSETEVHAEIDAKKGELRLARPPAGVGVGGELCDHNSQE